jgi:histidine phosphotransferase ChpT
VEVTGTNVRLPQAASLLLTGGSVESVDGHSIQPYYTTLLAKECRTVIRVSTSPESVSLIVPPRAGGGDQAAPEAGCKADTATYAFCPDGI